MENKNEEKISPSQLNLNYTKRKSEPYFNSFEYGNINFNTPFSYFLKTYYNKSINSYLLHREITGDSPNDRKFIFLMQSDILLTNKFEDENNEFNYVNTNPIIMKIDYKTVYIDKI
jgi:hypothetical protein